MNNLQRLTLLAFCFARAFSFESAQAKKPVITLESFAKAGITILENVTKAHRELHERCDIRECQHYRNAIEKIKTMAPDRQTFLNIERLNRVQLYIATLIIEQEYSYKPNSYSEDIIAAAKNVKSLLTYNYTGATKDLFKALTKLIELDKKAENYWLSGERL